MKKIAIHQSQYLPWAPYFRKVAQSDLFVIMDAVQFQKNGVQNRNKIRNKHEDFWLTIPVSGSINDLILEKSISNPLWKKKHWKSIRTAYQKAPYWYQYANKLEALYSQDYKSLFEVNDNVFKFIIKELEIDTDIVYLSDLNTQMSKSNLVLEICQKLDANVYLSGHGGKSYLNESDFSKRGIYIEYLTSEIPKYPQLYEGFSPGLSIIDMMMNVDLSVIKEYLYK
ncbi:WbqC family protein [Virgibacillus doumboii]|uniref:WbqC family protein n=1 Tax=Virgibacillus doumboii TaxID=2697503 RepID=UPI0013DFFA66|nr:WbqC family protein [Virgibacillus doumboii]